MGSVEQRKKIWSIPLLENAACCSCYFVTSIFYELILIRARDSVDFFFYVSYLINQT